jgi:hypothetical protein
MRPILPIGKINGNSLVTVILPIQNHDGNIGELLDGIVNQQYQNLEILFYHNQLASDATTIFDEYAAKDSRIRVIHEYEMKQESTGKEFPSVQLARYTKGDYIIFLREDSLISPIFVGNTVAYMQRKGIDKLTMLPLFRLKSFGAKLVLPSFTYILFSTLVFRLVKLSKRKGSGDALGLVTLFDAKVFAENQLSANESVSNIHTDFGQQTKPRKIREVTLLGSDDILCRINGSITINARRFGAITTSAFGGSKIATFVLAIIATISPIIVLFSFPFPLTLLYFTLLFASRMLVAKITGQSLTFNIIFWPLQHIVFLILFAFNGKVSK